MLMSLAELRDNPTLTARQTDAGTMASAVLTQSGERVITKAEAEQSKRDAAKAAAAPLTARAPSATTAPDETREPSTKRALIVGAALVVAALVWALRPEHDAPQAPKPAAAPAKASAPLATTQAPQAFAVQIDSSPNGADVFEGQQRLGSTPIQLSVDSASIASSPRTFTVRKAGYLPYTIVQGNSAKDIRLLAELVRAPAASSAPSLKPKKPAPLPPPHASAKPPPVGDHEARQGDIFMQR